MGHREEGLSLSTHKIWDLNWEHPSSQNHIVTSFTCFISRLESFKTATMN